MLAIIQLALGVTGRAVTQTAHQGLEEQDPPEPTDSIPPVTRTSTGESPVTRTSPGESPVTRTSPGESPDLSFILESVLLLPAADVAHQMGAENGALPENFHEVH